MYEERIIIINKVLRELNISLERAVDYLKDKGIAIESNPNTKISEDVYNVLCGQFAGDKGNKEASKEVGEEKRKEKEALRVEREKEIENKRKADEERLRKQEIIKARAVVTAPVQVGKIDLNPKKVVPVSNPTVAVEKPEVPAVTQAVVETKSISPGKPSTERAVVKAINGIKEKGVVKEVTPVAKKTPSAPVMDELVEETITTQ